jgi:hypothetical protein
VDVSWAKIKDVECTDPEKDNCKEYTVTLRAFYGPIEEEQTTTIQYCDGSNCKDPETLAVNEEYTIKGNQFTDK